MCGRVVQVSDPIRLSIVEGLNVRDTRLSNYPRRWNGAPKPRTPGHSPEPQDWPTFRSISSIKWGLIPYWCKDPSGGRKPINAKSETVAKLPTFRDAYQRRRCILPVDAFYEWKAIKGRKQPYAIAMKDRSPFGIAGIWDNWKNSKGGMGPHLRHRRHHAPDLPFETSLANSKHGAKAQAAAAAALRRYKRYICKGCGIRF